MTEEFAERYGPWAFVAGASMGIGAALSHEAAAPGPERGDGRPRRRPARGQRPPRSASATASRSAPSPPTCADLTSVVEAVAWSPTTSTSGSSSTTPTVAPDGRFVDVDLDLHLLSVDVNCRTPVVLCHHFGRRLAERGRGGIAMISSMGGTQGAVNFSTYNAGKAFEWILAETPVDRARRPAAST